MEQLWTERNIPKPAMRSTMQKLHQNIGRLNIAEL